MFGDKSTGIFWNIFKNKKDNNNASTESNELKVEEDLMTKIEKLPTYKKICLLQGYIRFFHRPKKKKHLIKNQ